MRYPKPSCPDTYISPCKGEWYPSTFAGCLLELENLAKIAETERSLLLYRGHADRHWRLDSTFVREFKRFFLQMDPADGFAEHLQESRDLNCTLTSLLLLKFGCLVRPSAELNTVVEEHDVDPVFELMKRFQQYPEEDLLPFKGTNLLDWSRDQNVALYFANDSRTEEGAIFICDATATGKTLQIITVDEILSKVREQMFSGSANGAPLLFSPGKQISYTRAKNQQAMYIAQMDLRLDLLEQWRIQEQSQPDSTIIVKLILPRNSIDACEDYLLRRGVSKTYLFPE